jgi:hypothetical protein
MTGGLGEKNQGGRSTSLAKRLISMPTSRFFGKRRNVFLLVWLVLFTLVSYKIFFSKPGESRISSGDLAIAYAESFRGEVKVRFSQSLQWNDIAENRYLMAYDSIATGPDGYAVINFANRHRIELIPNSQIRIVPVDGKNFELELVVGNVIVESRKESDVEKLIAAGLKIKGSSGEILSDSDKRTLAKSPSDSAEDTPDSIENGRIASDLLFPRSTEMLWVFDKAEASIPFTFKNDGKAASRNELKVTLTRQLPLGETAKKEWKQSDRKKNVVDLPLMDVLEANLIEKTHPDLPRYKINASLGGERKTFEFEMVEELDARKPWLLAVAGPKAIDSKMAWAAKPKHDISSNDAKIILRHGSDAALFKNLMIGSSSFAFAPAEFLLSDLAIYIVRRGQIVAKLSQHDPMRQQLPYLVRSLKADVAFLGKGHDLIGDAANVKKQLLSTGQLPEQLYLINEGELIGISKKFITSNKLGKKLLSNPAAHFFKVPVEIPKIR